MSDSFFLRDDFVATAPGEAYRLFPFGRIFKNGKLIEFTRELARRFRLPHFKPPIKLGSHANETPAGGHIVDLEIRDDGLYAIPEYTDAGADALTRGDYRYHSPEIVLGSMEDPETGEKIDGPFVIGDALLHTPHLGEAAALYSVSEFSSHSEVNMTENTVQVPAGWFERVMAFFDTQPREAEPITPQEPNNEPHEFEAALNDARGEIETLQAQVAQFEAQATRAQRVAHFASELSEIAAGDAELFGILAGLDDEAANTLVERFRATAEQARQGDLENEIGHAGGGDANDPAIQLDAAVDDLRREDNTLSYNDAVLALAVSRPELFNEVM